MRGLSCVVFLFLGMLSAQDLQNKTVSHTTFDVSPHWFVPLWSITNLKYQTANNTNLMFGVGYRAKSWWLEGMVWKQFNSGSGLWASDNRFSKKFGERSKTTLYAEPALFLSQKGFYWFMSSETVVWKNLALGAETENIHRSGPDTVAVGPRIAKPWGRLRGVDVSTVLSFRFDPLHHPGVVTGHPHEIRLYVIFNKRVSLAGLK